jgi:hypothetical protein
VPKEGSAKVEEAPMEEEKRWLYASIECFIGKRIGTAQGSSQTPADKLGNSHPGSSLPELFFWNVATAPVLDS